MNEKYLRDGRKVVIVGQINSTEYIVQEIYVSEDGDEFPTGEKFTTKNLLDQPAKSYAEKKKEEDEKALIILKSDINIEKNKIEKLRREKTLHVEHLSQIKAITENISSDELGLFVRFITGTVKYVVKDGYGITPPISLDEELTHPKNFSGGLKLLSILGNSDGKLSYNISQYGDGSGGGTTIIPFDSYQDAIIYIKELAEEKINNGQLYEKDYNICVNDLDITFSENHKNKYRQYSSEILYNSIMKMDKEIKTRQNVVIEANKKLEELKKI